MENLKTRKAKHCLTKNKKKLKLSKLHSYLFVRKKEYRKNFKVDKNFLLYFIAFLKKPWGGGCPDVSPHSV